MVQDKGNTAVHGDVDRVAMLSLRADGTPDQTAGVELIGDREFAEKVTQEQFRQQAASARHAAADTASAGDLPPQDVEDPTIAERQERNDAAIKDADAAAKSTVDALFVEPADAPALADPVKPVKPAPPK